MVARSQLTPLRARSHLVFPFVCERAVCVVLVKQGYLTEAQRISNANIFEASISRDEAHTTLVDDLLALFDGRPKPVMARLVESGKLALDDLKEAEDALKKMTKKGRQR
jgi:predicted transcriptional regulator